MFYLAFGQRQLKAKDTFGICQRPVFSLGVSQHMFKFFFFLNLWTFWFNWSSKLNQNNERKTPSALLHKSVSFQMPEKGRFQSWSLSPEVFLRLKYFSENLPLFQQLCYFRGRRFSQCLSTINSSPMLVTKFLCHYFILSCYHKCLVPLWGNPGIMTYLQAVYDECLRLSNNDQCLYNANWSLFNKY